MKIRIQYKKNCWLLMVEILLLFAVTNASLRLSSSGMSSLFRLVSPLAAVLLLIHYFMYYKKIFKLFLCMLFYSIIVSMLYYQNIAWDYYVFFTYIFLIYIFVKFYSLYSNNFKDEFYNFLDIVTTFSIFLCAIQFFIRIPYPFVMLPYGRGMGIYMWNENELAVPFSCMLIVYTFKVIYEKQKSLIWKILSIIFILFVNDAKLSMIGVTVGVSGLLLYKNMSEKKANKRMDPVCYTILAIGGIIAIVLITVIANPQLKFRGYSISINELLTKRIADIVMLRPTYGSGGSLVDRTNAIIFGLKELGNTRLLGIGLGNSVYMLSLPQYELLTAKSMHNFVFQMLSEFGIFCIILFCSMIKWVLKNIRKIGHSDIVILKIIFAIAFVFISSQSSIGILSNYYMWLIVFYILLLSDKRNGCLSDSKRQYMLENNFNMRYAFK